MNIKSQTVLPEGTKITRCPRMVARGADMGGIARPHANGWNRRDGVTAQRAGRSAIKLAGIMGRIQTETERAQRELDANAELDRDWQALMIKLGLPDCI